MNKEQLITLGLTEEQAVTIINGFGQMVPKSRLDDKIAELNEAKKEITTRDTQLEELKKIDGAGLQTKITELQQDNETTKTDYEAKLKETQLTGALKLALAGKVHDADLVIGQIDKSKIELGEDGNVTKGLEEQIKDLQTSKSFLFVPEAHSSGIKGATPPGGDPEGGNKGAINSFGKKLAEEAAKSNTGLEEARKSYFE
ncbi:phage scaffolding protein [Peribacillus loiseleuriae]|uniref:Chemotaxis protein n=1 Tax=Peribacillus loiseleuriae TaxID=1679170 RepID=A0A0K9GRE2_9BACI|nr:phage scaffolding protein [Peribacillus loiseleuriae]KMY49225.1 chemotaxis protein [Peribacillus loiseleuriae]